MYTNITYMTRLAGALATGLHGIHGLWCVYVLLHWHLNGHFDGYLHGHLHYPLYRHFNDLFNLNDLFDDFRLADTVVDVVTAFAADWLLLLSDWWWW